MHQAHCCRAVTDGGSNSLDRSVAGVSYCENARDRRLEWERYAARRPPGRMRSVRDDVASGFLSAVLSRDAPNDAASI